MDETTKTVTITSDASSWSSNLSSFYLPGGTPVLSPGGSATCVVFAKHSRMNFNDAMNLILACDAALRGETQFVKDLLPDGVTLAVDGEVIHRSRNRR